MPAFPHAAVAHEVCRDEWCLISRRAELGLRLAGVAPLLGWGCAASVSPNAEQLGCLRAGEALRQGLWAELWAGQLSAVII